MDVLSSILNAMVVDPEYHRFVCYLKTTFLVASAGDRYRVKWTTALMNGIFMFTKIFSIQSVVCIYLIQSLTRKTDISPWLFFGVTVNSSIICVSIEK